MFGSGCGDEFRAAFLCGGFPVQATSAASASMMPPVPCDDVPSAPHWLGRNVYVRRLPPVSATEMPGEIHVYNLFSRFGQVERLRVLRDHSTHLPLGSALVLFADPRAASMAVQMINAGAVPGAVADFWLPRSLVNNTPTSRQGSPTTGWTPPPTTGRNTPAPQEGEEGGEEEEEEEGEEGGEEEGGERVWVIDGLPATEEAAGPASPPVASIALRQRAE